MRPQLVRNEQRAQWENRPGSIPEAGIEATERRFANENSAIASNAMAPVITADPGQPHVTGSGAADESTPLCSESEVGEFRSRWTTIQSAFVDEPRHAVEDADNLVASLMKQLAEGFANERARLEKQWDRGDNVSTEDLRRSNATALSSIAS